MIGSSRSTLLITLGIGCIVLLVWMLSGRRTGHREMVNGAVTDVHQMDAEALEREIRSGLPVGSPLGDVEGFLGKRDIEFSFEAPSKTLYATARKLKGSTMASSKSLVLKFYFDDASKLKFIDSKVLYTGP